MAGILQTGTISHYNTAERDRTRDPRVGSELPNHSATCPQGN